MKDKFVFKKDNNTVWAYNYNIFVNGIYRGFIGRTSYKISTLQVCIPDYIPSREARKIAEYPFNKAKELIKKAFNRRIKEMQKEKEFWNNIKYLPRENGEIILNLARRCLELHPEAKFLLGDCDGCVATRKTPEGVLKWIDGLDSDIDVYVKGEEDCPLGWFFLTPGEDPDEVICDYTANEFCEEVMKGI